MPRLDRQIHKYVVDPSTGNVTMTEVKPIRTLMAKGRPTVHIQNGAYFYDSGEEIPAEEVRKLGLDPMMRDGAPTRMAPPPEVEEILKESEQEALREWAYELKGGPRKGRK